MKPTTNQSRRQFIKITAAGLAGLYAGTRFGFIPIAQAAIPGGTLDPLAVPRYATAMLVPPVMPAAGTVKQPGGAIDYYEISVRQFQQQVLPAGLPMTTVWGYGPVAAADPNAAMIHNAPSLTIEAKAGKAIRVKWINQLVNASGGYCSHLLPVDPTLHWANPPGGAAGRDMRPAFAATPGSYTGPVPMVTHVHGATGVGDESDGYAAAWYLPAANDIPPGYAPNGTWYDFMSGKATAAGHGGTAWGPGFATFQYGNTNRASTLWYHDHTLGMTRVNVYAGPAGFFLLRGGPGGDAAVLDSRSGAAATFPGPAPNAGDKFPPKKIYREICMAIQDRAFNADGSLFYPASRLFFDGYGGPYIPDSDLSPIWNPEFFGNMIMVNGATWPYQNVEQRRYRFRVLNGCQSRFLILDFNAIPGVEAWQVGNEGGFLAAPVNLTATNGNRLLMGLAERADLIVDFTNVPVGNYVLQNVGPDEPFGGGTPGVDFDPADPATTGQILQFRVGPSLTADLSTPPAFMVLPPIAPLPPATVTRKLALIEIPAANWDGPAEARLGVIDASGMATALAWEDAATETVSPGVTETWEIHNLTVDAHPMHVHATAFEVVDRQPLALDPATGEVAQPVALAGPARPAEPWETGLKDTVVAYPGEVTRIRVNFATAGQYVWHCHIVEHEDNEMMRPLRVGPPQPGQPA